MKNKTIIIHDTFLYKWWWERLILMMAKLLKADIASWFFSKGSFDLQKEGFNGKIIEISSEIFRKWFRHIKLKFAFLFNTKFLKKYDTVIFSWDCISAVRNCNRNSKKIYYCHTPPRYLYDLKNLYIKKVPFLLRPIFLIVSYVFKKMYENDISKMDLVLTNSENTKNRIKKFLWIDAKILYPPVDLEEFKYISQEKYYLSFARLAWAKRVDIIVKAFLKMPDKKLVVIHWKNDPDKKEIFDLAKWHKNIEFFTWLWNKEFLGYVWNCIATIYIPIDEDFGMSPVESMSAWKPVIWVNDWGLKETIIDKKTWILLNKEISVKDIIKWVKYLTPEKSLSMRIDCEKRAKYFSLENFEKEINEYIWK